MTDIDCDIEGPGDVVACVARRWPISRRYLPVDSDDCAPGLEAEPGGACASFDCDYDDHHTMHRMIFLERSKVWACVDCGHVDRPSPGDDVMTDLATPNRIAIGAFVAIVGVGGYRMARKDVRKRGAHADGSLDGGSLRLVV